MSDTKHTRIVSCIVGLLCLLLAGPVVADESAAAPSDTGSLLDMPLEQLVEVAVGGTLTETDPRKAPGNITVITANDIALTPARNLLDLIEIYVPSAIWLTHSVGPELAIRGIVADRNYKYLILVNGIRVNNGIAYGAQAELSMWDLSDIEKVEIIRGPGSVTYGPGAIAGVINITTKRAKTAPGTQVSAFYWDKYMARGASIGHGYQGKQDDEIDVYGFFSYTDVLGWSPDIFLARADAGYYLGDAAVSSGRPPETYMGPFFGDPQLKGYVDIDFKNGWRFWSRYTDGLIPNNTYSDTQYILIRNSGGPYRDFRNIRIRQFNAVAENTQKLNEDWDLTATFSFTSTETLQIIRHNNVVGFINSEDNLQNMSLYVTENRFFNRLQFNYDPKDTWKAAFGTEFSYTVFGPGWGKGRHDGLRVDDMISGPGSEAYDPTSTSNGLTGPGSANYIPLGHGWKANAHAVFGEVKMDLADRWSTLVSARVDKHSYTDYMFSPRFSLTHELEPEHYLKFVAQRSVRMNTEEELYKMNYSGASVKPEKLTTYELMYQVYEENGWDYRASTFYNDNEVIAWNGGTRSSTPVGDLKTIGAELEAAYKNENLEVGASHSYVKQLEWTLADDVATSGISYGDFFYTSSGGIYYRDTGNDLSNYSDHITKIFGNLRMPDQKLTLHADMRVLWGFPGGKDGLDMVRHGGGSTGAYDDLEDRDAYEMIITGNFSLTYELTKSSTVALYVQNIPIYGDNKRYCYSSGHRNSYPEKTAWIEEPLVVGARYTARF